MGAPLPSEEVPQDLPRELVSSWQNSRFRCQVISCERRGVFQLYEETRPANRFLCHVCIRSYDWSQKAGCFVPRVHQKLMPTTIERAIALLKGD